MRKLLWLALVIMSFLLRPLSLEAAGSETRQVDVGHSTMTVHVYKSGLFSAFAHNHEIRAPIQAGEVNESGDKSSVVLSVDSQKLRVLDPEASEGTRAQIQETMLGTQVLSANRFPEIQFKSTAVESKGKDHWMMRGNLKLHGVEHPISFEITLKDDRYRGSVTLKQTDFGMTPVTIAGGTVKVKDEVKVEFEIALMQ